MFGYLADDEIDAAFCLLARQLPDEMASERLGDDEVVVAFSPDAAPPDPRVDVAELGQRTIVGPRRGSAVTSVVEERLARAGSPLRLALESGDPFLLRALAARGFGAAILPRSLTELAGPPVALRSLDPPETLQVALVWRRLRHPSPAARTFIDFVRQWATRAAAPPRSASRDG
jgi:DNA-binding transcriptional LysR family regulator